MSRSSLSSCGRLLQATALAHGVVGAVLYRDALVGIARGGLVNQVPERGDAATAFWFMTAAPSLWLSGRLLRAAERSNDVAAQRVSGRLLVGVGIVGSAAMPVGGFWAVTAIGIATWRAASQRRRPTRS